MKINDIDIYLKKDGNFVIGRKNKRGNIKSDFKNVTRAVIEFFIKAFLTTEGHYKQYKIGDDYYKIKMIKMTKEEVQAQTEKYAKNSKPNNIFALMSYIYTLNSHDDMFSPVKLKECHKSM